MAGMGVYKPSGRHRTWQVRFFDHRHIRRVIKGFNSKRDSETLCRTLERMARSIAAGAGVPEDMRDWVDHKLDDGRREKLITWGMISRTSVATIVALTKHLESWQAWLEGNGRSEKHVRQSVDRARMLLVDRCEFQTHSDIDVERVASEVGGLDYETGPRHRRVRKPLSASTRRHILRAAKMFTKWMCDSGRVNADALRRLPVASVRGGPVRVRRVLSDDEMGRLLEAARHGGRRGSMTGPERWLLYRVAAETGYRAAELNAIRRCDMHLIGHAPRIKLDGVNTKNGKDASQRISAELAADLADAVGHKAPLARAFTMPLNLTYMAEVLRFDLEAAGIAYETNEGTFDFHAFRHVLGTRLARAGVHPKMAQQIMRHSSITLTMQLYTHVGGDDINGAFEAMHQSVTTGVTTMATNGGENEQTRTNINAG